MNSLFVVISPSFKAILPLTSTYFIPLGEVSLSNVALSFNSSNEKIVRSPLAPIERVPALSP